MSQIVVNKFLFSFCLILKYIFVLPEIRVIWELVPASVRGYPVFGYRFTALIVCHPLVNNVYTVNEFDLLGGTLSRKTWWINLVIVGVGVVFQTKWLHDIADICRVESKEQRPMYGPLQHSTDNITGTWYSAVQMDRLHSIFDIWS